MLDEKIFKREDGYYRWDYQIEYYLNKIEDKSLKGRIISAIQNLSNEFGRSFLKNCHIHHPINFAVANKAEHSVKWLIWLSESLIKTKIKSRNFNVLSKKIIRRKSAVEEGILFLTVANWFATNDNLIEFEPKTNLTSKADIKIKISEIETDLYVEISNIKEDKFHKTHNAILSHISNQISNKGLNFAGNILREVNSDELQMALVQITRCITKCYHEDAFVKLDSIDTIGVLQFGFAPYAIKNDFDLWSKKNKLIHSQITGPPLNTNLSLAKSLDRKLKKEANQIQYNEAGLIILNIGVLHFLYLDWERIAEYMEAIMKSWKFQNIIGVVLLKDAAWSVTKKKISKFQNSVYIEAPLWGIQSRKMLFSSNPNCNIDKQKRMYIEEIIKSIPEYNNV